MKLYNTLTRGLQEFEPGGDVVTIYTCGPTVYAYQHIGNYAAFVYWDVLIRALNADGRKVKRVLNLTDVGHLTSDADEGEDKMAVGAKREGKTVWEVAEFYADDFLKHFRGLGLVWPDAISKATDYIEANIQLVEQLLKDGYAYETSDGIYYDISKFPNYADLGKLDLDGLMCGASGRVDCSDEKKNAGDFAIWKFIPEGEDHAMRWKAFGRDGYPGWHMECVAIIFANLGETIDIHTGGIEHIPVHHTNEIAEAEAASGKPLARYWLHNNHVMIDGQKISKSLGNVVLMPEVLSRGFSYDEFKFWVQQGHYQKERNFTWEELAAAAARLARWRQRAVMRHQVPTEAVPVSVFDAINDNLNTAQMMADIDEVLKTTVPDEDFWLEVDRRLGLQIVDETPALDELRAAVLAEYGKAREAKDYETADRLRDELLAQGVQVNATADAVTYHYIR
ncbi:class I tRNA ligase family protein [Candidatus Saccharibacteria bacterium]|nr:class I tRNA ligase family protein [Candidatus Saccharibacteria bacterium]